MPTNLKPCADGFRVQPCFSKLAKQFFLQRSGTQELHGEEPEAYSHLTLWLEKSIPYTVITDGVATVRCSIKAPPHLKRVFLRVTEWRFALQQSSIVSGDETGISLVLEVKSWEEAPEARERGLLLRNVMESQWNSVEAAEEIRNYLKYFKHRRTRDIARRMTGSTGGYRAPDIYNVIGQYLVERKGRTISKRVRTGINEQIGIARVEMISIAQVIKIPREKGYCEKLQGFLEVSSTDLEGLV